MAQLPNINNFSSRQITTALMVGLFVLVVICIFVYGLRESFIHPHIEEGALESGDKYFSIESEEFIEETLLVSTSSEGVLDDDPVAIEVEEVVVKTIPVTPTKEIVPKKPVENKVVVNNPPVLIIEPDVVVETEPVNIITAKKTDQAVGMSLADDLPGLSQKELNEWLDDMISLGITWIRLDFDWSWIQSNPDKEIDWTKIDRVVLAARARNIELLPILVYTPLWARAEECNYSNRCPPANPDHFAAFATAAVTRYAPMGIHQWEIWNEPNMRGSWLPEANAWEYTRLLFPAYVAIKEVDPSAIVVSGGIGPITTENGNIEALEYLQDMYDVGAGPYFDAVGFHPYSFPALPSHEMKWNAWQQAGNTETSFRSIMIANGDSFKKIWITEYGAPTGGPRNAADSDYNYSGGVSHVTEEFQAEVMADAIEDIDTYDWAGPLFLYSYKDYGKSEDTTENFYGIIRHDGTKKPAYEMLADVLD